jgi:hypothetical protein
MGKGKHPQPRARPGSTSKKLTELINAVRDAVQPPAGPSPADEQLEALAAACRAHDANATLNPNELGVASIDEVPPTINPMANIHPEDALRRPSQATMETLADSTPSRPAVTGANTSSLPPLPNPVGTREDTPTGMPPIPFPRSEDGPAAPPEDKDRPALPLEDLATLSISENAASESTDQRRVDRPLTWDEMWAAWPVLGAEAIKSVREGHLPTETIGWS